MRFWVGLILLLTAMANAAPRIVLPPSQATAVWELDPAGHLTAFASGAVIWAANRDTLRLHPERWPTFYSPWMPERPDGYMRQILGAGGGRYRSFVNLAVGSVALGLFDHLEIWLLEHDSAGAVISSERMRYQPFDDSNSRFAADDSGCVLNLNYRHWVWLRQTSVGTWNILDTLLMRVPTDYNYPLSFHEDWAVLCGVDSGYLLHWPPDGDFHLFTSGRSLISPPRDGIAWIGEWDSLFRVSLRSGLPVRETWFRPEPPFLIGSSLYGGLGDSFVVAVSGGGMFEVILRPDTIETEYCGHSSGNGPYWWNDTARFLDRNTLFLEHVRPRHFQVDSILLPGIVRCEQFNNYMYLRNAADSAEAAYLVDLDAETLSVVRIPVRFSGLRTTVMGYFQHMLTVFVMGVTPDSNCIYLLDASDPTSPFVADSILRLMPFGPIRCTDRAWLLYYSDSLGARMILAALTPDHHIVIRDSIFDDPYCYPGPAGEYLITTGDGWHWGEPMESLLVWRWDTAGFENLGWLRAPGRTRPALLGGRFIYWIQEIDSTGAPGYYLRSSLPSGTIEVDTIHFGPLSFFRGDTIITGGAVWFVPDADGHWVRLDSTWCGGEYGVGEHWVVTNTGYQSGFGVLAWERYPFTAVEGEFTADRADVTGLSLHPNPTTGPLNVVVDAAQAGIATLDITDGLGRLLGSQCVRLNTGRNEQVVDLTDFPSGIYLVRLRGEGLSISRMVVHLR